MSRIWTPPFFPTGAPGSNSSFIPDLDFVSTGDTGSLTEYPMGMDRLDTYPQTELMSPMRWLRRVRTWGMSVRCTLLSGPFNFSFTLENDVEQNELGRTCAMNPLRGSATIIDTHGYRVDGALYFGLSEGGGVTAFPSVGMVKGGQYYPKLKVAAALIGLETPPDGLIQSVAFDPVLPGEYDVPGSMDGVSLDFMAVSTTAYPIISVTLAPLTFWPYANDNGQPIYDDFGGIIPGRNPITDP